MEFTPPILFDRVRLRKRRARAAGQFGQHDFLHREAAERAAETLSFLTHRFPTIIELGAHTGHLAAQLATRVGTQRYIACDVTPQCIPASTTAMRVAVDEEYLPFAAESAAAVVSLLALHWVNDLPGTLAQIYRILKPDGLFMAILPGGETLRELRQVLATVETARNGGIHPRIAPFIDVRDAGALLQRAGFALPVADSEILTVTYPNLMALMHDLRGAAQSNMLQQQTQHFTPRGFFLDAAMHYAEQYSDAENQLTATVEFVTLTGWKPSSTQQQPAKRGSGTMSFAQLN